jgi:hypothetical protein
MLHSCPDVPGGVSEYSVSCMGGSNRLVLTSDEVNVMRGTSRHYEDDI